jgi:hypothetical protein
MKSIWLSIVIALTIIGVSTPAFAIPIYVVDDSRSGGGYSSKIVVMDSATHAETTLNFGTGKRMTDIAITPSGSRLYTITGDGSPSLYRFDVYGHQLKSWNLGGIGGTGFKNALVAESETSLLFMSNDKTNIWRITLNADGNYASTTNLGSVGLYSSGDLAISPGGVLYLSSVNLPNSPTAINKLYRINLGSLSATLIGTIHEGGHNLTQIYGLAFDEDGVLYGGRGAWGVAEDVYTINLVNASATYGWTMQCVPPTGINGFASVPEPATICLLGLGALSLIRSSRRRREP